MDIDDIEKNLHMHPTSQSKVLEMLLYKNIENNALLRVILDNQSKINSMLNPSKTQGEYADELKQQVEQLKTEIFASVVSYMSGS